MSIISWTSPRPSDSILPTSIETSRPRALVGAQLFAKEPHEFTSLGTRDQTPLEESRVSPFDRHGRVGGGDLPDVRHGFAGNWGFRDQRAAVIADRFDTELKQKRVDIGLECEVSGFGGLLDHID
jgi:hypothetical protein